MVNNRAKMQRTNGKVRKWLEANGYRNIYFFPHSRFSKDYHITLKEESADFDGLAHDDNHILFFQCKTNRRATKRVLKLYAELSERFKSLKFIWFNAIDRKGLTQNNLKC